MAEAVLDSSAILAVLLQESGAEAVTDLMDRALVSAVNVAEVLTRLQDKGMDFSNAAAAVDDLQMTVADFTHQNARACAALRRRTRAAGLSLGDRACLALAQSTGLPVYTADRPWRRLDLPVEIRFIR